MPNRADVRFDAPDTLGRNRWDLQYVSACELFEHVIHQLIRPWDVRHKFTEALDDLHGPVLKDLLQLR